MNARRTLVAASLGYFVIVLDTTIVNVALPSIGSDLGADLRDLQWIVDSYVVVFAGLLLSSGSLSDRFGAERCYVAGMAAFAVASVACAAAPSLEVLLGARVIQGAAAALLVPSSLSLIRAAYPDQGERARAIAIWAAIGGGALAAGPVLGGLLTDAIDWRAIFAINIPIAVAAVLATTGAKEEPRRSEPLDLAGQIAAIVAIGALTFAVIESGHEGVGSAATLTSAALAVAGLALFVRIERRSSHPSIPRALYRWGPVSGAAAMGLIFNFSFYGQVFVLSLFFQEGLGLTPLQAGLMFLPLTVLTTGSNVVVGRLAERYGARPPIFLGQLLMALGFVGLASVDTGTSIPVILVLLIPLGVGGGLVIPPLTAVLLDHAPQGQAGLVSGTFNASRQLGGGLGVAVFGAMIASGFDSGMPASMMVAAAGIAVTFAIAAASLPRTVRIAS